MRIRGGCFVFVLLAACGKPTPEEQVATATHGCKARYDAIERWITGRNRMPGTDAELVAAGAHTEPDPWGHDYVIEREGRAILVWSWGPDGIEGTDDDISYPPVD